MLLMVPGAEAFLWCLRIGYSEGGRTSRERGEGLTMPDEPQKGRSAGGWTLTIIIVIIIIAVAVLLETR
jgi:hypothetical protein